ncbi:hypothetical protein [Saccharicrinis fermentans]|nr:hypothetical protein [Saccharicrinis fermentans]
MNKNMRFLIFFGIILGIHFLVNFYIYKRGVQGLGAMPQLLPYLRGIMLFLTLAYPAGRFLEKIWYSPISSFIHWSGAFWFAGMLYFVLIIFTLDLFRWSNMLFHFMPDKLSSNYTHKTHHHLCRKCLGGGDCFTGTYKRMDT